MTAASPATPAPGTIRFEDVLLTRTVRAIEDSGPLEDASELRDAARQAATPEGRIVARARALAMRIGLLADMERIGALATLVVPLMAILVVGLTWVLVSAVLGEGRRINVVLAWLGVLGPSFVSLAVWVAAVLAPGSKALATLTRGLGGIALWMSSRPRWTRPHAPVLVREGLDLLGEARLLPWAFGAINHALWALAFVGLIGVLYVMFALRAYQLTWESTILPESAFIDFIAATGRPAALLGLPNAELGASRPGPAPTNASLAFWLMYCVLLYGLVPRLLLAAWSWRRWARAKDRLRLDTADPYFRRLVHRFDQLAEPVVVDAEQPVAGLPGPAGASASDRPLGAPVWIAFELPAELVWHEEGLTVLDVAGDSEGRHRVIDRLAREPVARATVVCHAASSPDRGTARFLRDVSSHVGELALLLVGEDGGDASRVSLWTSWLKDVGLGRTPVFEQTHAARDWQAAEGTA